MKQLEANRLLLDGAEDEEISRLLEVPLTTVARWRKYLTKAVPKHHERQQRKRDKRNERRRKNFTPLTEEQRAINQLKREGFDMETIRKVFGSVAMLAVATMLHVMAGAPLHAQTHTPADPVVQGDLVTLDGSIAWHDAGIDSLVVQGSTLGLPGIYSSAGGGDPIKLRMPPGTHEITVLGFPDAGTNLRASVVQSVTIGEPTRVAQLVEAYRRLFAAQDAWRAAHEAIEAIKPTRDEVIEALGIAFGGT